MYPPLFTEENIGYAGNIFHPMDLPNSMIWILSESVNLPDIFHSTETNDFYGKSKFIQR